MSAVSFGPQCFSVRDRAGFLFAAALKYLDAGWLTDGSQNRSRRVAAALGSFVSVLLLACRDCVGCV